MLLLTPTGFLPHCWHIPNGGVPLGAGVWARRYGVVPADATPGAVVHELGHLLFDWPDLTWDFQFEQECLMARGAFARHGLDPAPPCAPLLVDAGWRDTVPLGAGLTAGGLGPEQVAAVEWLGRPCLVERRECALLVYETGSGAAPRILGRVALAAGDLARSVLGLVAPLLRRERPPSRP